MLEKQFILINAFNLKRISRVINSFSMKWSYKNICYIYDFCYRLFVNNTENKYIEIDYNFFLKNTYINIYNLNLLRIIFIKFY